MTTLQSLLRASPRFLQVYQQAREYIISHVVCNHITPAALPIALDILEQGKLRTDRRYRTDVLSFLATFKQPGVISVPVQFSLETSTQLMRKSFYCRALHRRIRCRLPQHLLQAY